MRELSIFIDESGDAGHVSRFYLISLVFHNQSDSIDSALSAYEYSLAVQNLDLIPFHFGPLLNGNDDYRWKGIRNRRKQLVAFSMLCNRLPITYATFSYEKRGANSSPSELSRRIEQDVRRFIANNLEQFQSYDKIKIYYDGGQSIVTQAIHTAIEETISRQAAIYKDASPRTYRLSQAADYICGVELTSLKFEHSSETKTDLEFFDNKRQFKKNYLKKIRRKRLN